MSKQAAPLPPVPEQEPGTFLTPKRIAVSGLVVEVALRFVDR